MLPQQRLLLELLLMSGDIGVTKAPDDGVLWRTLRECQSKGWLTVKLVGPDLHSAIITAVGRQQAQAKPAR